MAGLSSVLLLALLIVCEVSSQQGDVANNELLQQYLDRLQGELVVCPICDARCYRRKSQRDSAFMMSWFRNVLDHANRILRDNNVGNFTLRMPPDYEYIPSMEAVTRYTLDLSLMGTDLYSAMDLFWQLRFPMLFYGGSVFNQFKTRHGCELGVLFVDQDERLIQTTSATGAADVNGLCGAHSYAAVANVGNSVYIGTILAHEITHQLGLKHSGETPSWLSADQMNLNSFNTDGTALLTAITGSCSASPVCSSQHCLMDDVPPSAETKLPELSQCERLMLAFNSYKQTKGLSISFQCLLD